MQQEEQELKFGILISVGIPNLRYSKYNITKIAKIPRGSPTLKPTIRPTLSEKMYFKLSFKKMMKEFSI